MNGLTASNGGLGWDIKQRNSEHFVSMKSNPESILLAIQNVLRVFRLEPVN